MIKLIHLWALAVALAVASTYEVAPESEVDPEIEMEPNNADRLLIGFDFWINGTNETNDAVERVENPETRDNLQTDIGLESEANETEMITPSGGQRIKGGNYTDIHEHPYQVSIMQRRYHFTYWCSGSIVSKQWVLTAASCLMGAPVEFLVRSGSRYNKTGGYRHEVSSLYIHYLYDPNTHDYDIGVMRIAGVFEFNQFVQPIKLAKALPKPGDHVSVAGWGLTKYKGLGSARLQVVNLTVTTEDVCKKSFPGVTSRKFCAGHAPGGRGACDGDSGAPLVADEVQVGIVSQYKCEDAKLPTVFTKVSFFRSWIQYYTGD